jgi:hypothetical protein
MVKATTFTGFTSLWMVKLSDTGGTVRVVAALS